MEIEFRKYQGAGNDFIMLDNFSGKYDDLTLSDIQKLCDRRFGIGADGLIKINNNPDWDFQMDYYNSDGSQSFCGNGARCAVRFVANHLLKKDVFDFLAIDGVHEASVMKENISLEMKDVDLIKTMDSKTYELNTGSPHYILFTDNVESFDIYTFGKEIRYSPSYRQNGINVNAVEERATNSLFIRTYERGVENETLACGTGITAAALAYAQKNKLEGDIKVAIKAMGGDLSVHFHRMENNSFKYIKLIGPANFVYSGYMTI
jgi:diaminopimelate epimerase